MRGPATDETDRVADVPDRDSVLTPPVADRRPVERTHHGDTFVDPYEWLRDKENPEVISLLEAENAYAEGQTAHLASLRASLFDDYKARTQETDLSVPSYETHTTGQAYWYYSRTIEGKDYPLWCRVPASSQDEVPDLTGGSLPGEQVMLDGNVEAEGEKFFSLGALEVSPDGSRLLWAVDNSGDERYDVKLRQLADGSTTSIQRGIAANVTFGNDEWLFYTTVDEAWRPHQVWRHRLGSDPASDALVHQEDDERFWLWVGTSRDRSWVVLTLGSKLTGEARLVPTADPTATPRLVTPRREGLDYQVEATAERLWIIHNDRHPDFELACAPISDGEVAAPFDTWVSVLEPRPGERISEVEAYADHVVVEGRREGLPAVWIAPASDPASAEPLAFEEPLYEVSSSAHADFTTDRIRLNYTSMVTPHQVREVRLDTGVQTVLKQTPVLDHPRFGPYNPADYVQERAWATAGDGTRIPLSIVRRATTPVDASAPLVLYGYGSYEASMPIRFSVPRLSLLDHGFIYVITHIRGGGEMGRAWYEEGKLLAKTNTFTDFVDSARWLVDNGWTSPDRMVAEGGSAGGLLMGAVANLAPELFAGVHAAVPFVDALTTILNPDLPLTVTEWEEWGNPLEDAEVYAYMKSYSPYENLREVAYPAILATTGLNDTRVYYVEPLKWVQELRRTSHWGGQNPILLRTEMVAGHAGVTGRYEKWRELAWEMAWIIDRGGRGRAEGVQS